MPHLLNRARCAHSGLGAISQGLPGVTLGGRTQGTSGVNDVFEMVTKRGC